MRIDVIAEIEKLGVNINVEFLKMQKGIYMFLDLNEKQNNSLAEEFGIFLCGGGRVNLSAINDSNIQYFVSSLKSVLALTEN